MTRGNALAAQRRKARHFALQALYQWAMAPASAVEIEAQFRTDYDFSAVDGEYFEALLRGTIADAGTLDGLYEPFLDRALHELDPVERSLLRMGTYELRERLDVPFRVVISEAVALASKFGAAESHRYINGVLDRVARELRRAEQPAAPG